MSTSLELKQLGKRYGATEALRDFDLTVAPGEFVTILGPSGSGKTTALKLIAGFEEPSAGDVLIGGTSVVDVPAYRRGIGMVFQNYALFPHLSVAENIAFPLRVRDWPRDRIGERVDNALDLVRLKGYGDRFPSQLSGGQQQRVALARAVVFDPAILLMDEPLGALDRNLRDEMKQEIKRVQSALEVTVVYVTHDQDEALAMSDRIAVMRNGEMAQIGTAQDLYARPENLFVARFLGESNLLRCRPHGPGQVRLEGDIVVSAPSERDAPEGDCWLLVRPERIDVRDQEASAPGAVHGTVEEVVFLGENLRYVVRAGPHRLIVKVQNRRRGQPRPGEPIVLWWPPEDAILLRDEPAGADLTQPALD